LSDKQLTVSGEGEYSITLQKSKFIAHIFPCTSIDSFKEKLVQIKKLHTKATHHCFAYQLSNPSTSRANDDGEPNGTAGLPILGQIRSNQLTNVACIVVRYYGGSKLGVPGLINAYKLASSGAITSANLIPYRESISLKIVGPYGTLMKFLGVCHQNMWDARLDTYNGEPMIQLTIETDLAQGVLNKILLFSELTRID
jgi:uncharacterized YigZ family protein